MRYITNIDSRIKSSPMEDKWDLPNYIVFSGNFTEDSATKFRHELEAAESLAGRSKQDIIPIIIDSYGGSAYALLSMVDAIKNCKIPVATIVEGKAMSCGAVLFSCGAEGHRYIGPNATILIHDVSSSAFGKEPDLHASAEEATRLNKLVYKIMAENCGHKSNPYYFYDLVAERRNADWYITPEEAVKHGLANKIHIPSLEINVSLDWKFF